MIKWECTLEELEKISKICDRAWPRHEALGYTDRLTMMMDLEACHCNGCPLDLDGLYHAQFIDFMHDVGGIGYYIDRETGCLTNCFLPRYAKKQ